MLIGYRNAVKSPVAAPALGWRSCAMRIASLLASATEIAVALGLEDQIVAISHECDYPPDVLDRPRVSRPRFEPDGLSAGDIDAAVRSAMAQYGSMYELDVDLLRWTLWQALTPDGVNDRQLRMSSSKRTLLDAVQFGWLSSPWFSAIGVAQVVE